MDPIGREHQAVAVVRVIRHGSGDSSTLLIELLEVGHEFKQDRLLGRSTSVGGACRALELWLTALIDSERG